MDVDLFFPVFIQSPDDRHVVVRFAYYCCELSKRKLSTDMINMFMHKLVSFVSVGFKGVTETMCFIEKREGNAESMSDWQVFC